MIMLFTIKRLINLEDFKRVFRVFEAPPYNEVWADTDLLSEFNLLNSQGYIFGCYLDNFCIGLISIRDKLDSDNHAVNYYNKKVIYLSDMVYRNFDTLALQRGYYYMSLTLQKNLTMK
jgi:hypothetical protein